MCGIAAFLNVSFDLNKIKKVQQTLYHRGPDDQTFYQDPSYPVSLVHTRLSIQDVKHGQQPFCYEDYVIILNGEIYNHLELRENLKSFRFKTQSDTETLLYLFIQYGEKCFELIDGMYAFIIYNKKNKQVFIARDRAGKKPLYYAKQNKSGQTSLGASESGWVFSSELNGLKAILDLSPNHEAISSFIRCGFFTEAHTAYQDVLNFPAGSYAYLELSSSNLNKNNLDKSNLGIKAISYFSIQDLYQTQAQTQNDKTSKNSIIPNSETAYLDQLDKCLHTSVKNRLLSSELEVGAFLSGGIDSNLITAIAKQYQPNLRTFTVKTTGKLDESELAKIAAQYYGTNHTELDMSMNLESDIDKILLNYGQPFMDSSAIPSYYVAQEAKKHITVVLNGDGADELFAGYRRYVPVANNWLKIAKYFSGLCAVLPKPKQKQSLYNYAHRLLSMSKKTGLDFYLSATIDSFEDVYDFKSDPKFSQNNVLDKLDQDLSELWADKSLSELDKLLISDFKHILRANLLPKMDIATMANSLEGRSPFLSKSILEFAPTLPNNYKIHKKTTKYLLRELAKKYCPEIIVNQPKRGFEVPLQNWVEGGLKDRIHASLSQPKLVNQYLGQKFINKLLTNSVSVSPIKRAKMLWTLFCVEVWACE
jgi:asparagine synthase (glutamine-hydrolysing)